MLAGISGLFRLTRKRVALQSVVGFSLLVLGAGSGCKAEKPWPLWDKYAERFLDNQGRVIDHTDADVTTSEGEAYAMFFALVANDQPRFEKLLKWTEMNLAQGDLTLHLPAWRWGKSNDGSWRPLDNNSASDADLWMAYSLSEAGRLWNNPRYASLGAVIAERVAAQEIVNVPMVGTTLLPGTIGYHPDPQTYYLNPSYLPPQLLAYFGRTPGSPWKAVAQSLPVLVGKTGGFAMDWIRISPLGFEAMPHPSHILDKPWPDPVGSYDAIRVYLWLGIADAGTPGVKESLKELGGMRDYLAKNVTPPLAVTSSGAVKNPDGPAGFSAAVIPYLHALNRTDLEKRQQERIDATLDPTTGLYGHQGAYFDQNLVLFESGRMSGYYGFERDGRLKVKWVK